MGIVIVDRPAVVVQVHVSQAGTRRGQKGPERAADGRMADVEHEAQLAQVELARGGEDRMAGYQVLDGDGHAELTLQLGKLGDRDLHGGDSRRIARSRH